MNLEESYIGNPLYIYIHSFILGSRTLASNHKWWEKKYNTKMWGFWPGTWKLQAWAGTRGISMYYSYHSPCIYNNNNKAIMLSSFELEKITVLLSIIIWVSFLWGVRSPTLLCIILYVVSHDHGTWESLSLWHVLLHLHNAKTHVWVHMGES